MFTHYQTNVAQQLRINRDIFKKKLETWRRQPNLETTQKLVDFFVFQRMCGVWYCPEIHQYLINYAKEHSGHSVGETSNTPKTGTLHVLTEGYASGGHTRVLERWVEQDPDGGPHTVIVYDQKDTRAIEPLKQKVLNQGGEFIVIPRDTPMMDKVETLRQRACEVYQRIVLHTHMNDMVPVMAFGVPAFREKRIPVIAFNHGGHRASLLGPEYVNATIEIEAGQQAITHHLRNIPSVLSAIPADDLTKTPPSCEEKRELRKTLGLPEDSIVLLSMARSYKFAPIQGYSFSPAGEQAPLEQEPLVFTKAMQDVLQQNPSAHLVLIGVAPESSIWRSLNKNLRNRVHFLKEMPYPKISDYLRAADVYLDPFYNSWTSMVDALSAGLPVLTLRTPVGLPIFFDDNTGVAIDVSDWHQKVRELIENPDKRSSLHERQLENMKRCQPDASFYQRIQSCVEQGQGDRYIADCPQDSQGFYRLDYQNGALEMSGGKTTFYGIPGVIGVQRTKTSYGARNARLVFPFLEATWPCLRQHFFAERSR
jgi:glycosyltransferase involved in cell wall biosynthesis